MCARGIARFEALGARVVEVEIPWARLGQVAYAATVGPEGAEYHRKFLENHRGRVRIPRSGFFRVQPLHSGLAVRAGRKRPEHSSSARAAEVFKKVGRRAHAHRRYRASHNRGLFGRHENVADSER